jgi:hypothetical protein
MDINFLYAKADVKFEVGNPCEASQRDEFETISNAPNSKDPLSLGHLKIRICFACLREVPHCGTKAGIPIFGF